MPAVERLAGEKVPDVVRVPVTFKLVVVALVVVELIAVKFWRVDEPVTKRLPRVARPELLKMVLNALVKVPIEEKKLVEVELVVVELRAVKL